MTISDLITLGIGPGGSPSDLILMGLSPSPAAQTALVGPVTVQWFAKLGGTWTDISADVLHDKGSSAEWGMNSPSPLDLIAKPGRAAFTLNNSSAKYYPDGASPLSGWDFGTEVRCVFTYDSASYIKFHGWVTGLKLNPGKHQNEDTVSVTMADWLEYSSRTNITAPDTQTGVLSSQAINDVVARNTLQPALNIMEGDETFDVVFDTNTNRSTSYSEFAKIVHSELGRLYLRQNPLLGGELVFESASYREGTVPLSSIPVKSATAGYLLDEDDEALLDEDDEPLIVSDYAALGTLSTGYAEFDPQYGKHIVNRIVQTVYPKKVDEYPTVVYTLEEPILIPAGETRTLQAQYTDPNTGRKINVVTGEGVQPEAPGGTDTSLQVAVNFNTAVTDETGNVTFTDNGIEIANTFHQDGYLATDVANSISGSYGMFGGYSPYSIEATSTKFDVTREWFIRWWSCTINITAAADITSDLNSTYPGYSLGHNNPDGYKKIYMSSNGTSFDIADGKSFGRVAGSRWTLYTLTYKNGWWTAYANRERTDTWYSTTLPRASGLFSVGKITGSYYAYMAFDRLEIRNKVPDVIDWDATVDLSATLPGDYWLNTQKDKTGTDLSSDLTATAVYGAEQATITLANGGETDDGYAFVQLRAPGIYPYNSYTQVYEDTTSQQGQWGIRELSINQKYQQSHVNSSAYLQAIIDNRKNPLTDLERITFCANRSNELMWAFLALDVGSKVAISNARSGISANYYIQKVEWETDGQIVFFTWTVQQDF